MPLTVRQLVARPELQLTVLVEGDLDRPISWLHGTEMPDASNVLDGGEVVLTAGIWYWAGTSGASFVDQLCKADVAALGFGPSPLLEEVPDDIVEACRATGLTLFRVTPGVTFLQISKSYFASYVAERAQPLRESLDRSEELARSLVGDEGVPGVLRVLARWRPGWVGVVDARRGIVASEGATPPRQEQLRALLDRRPVPGWLAYPVPGRSTDATLVVEVPGSRLAPDERALVDQVLPFIGIELQRERTVRETVRRFAVELFDLVAAGDAHQTAGIARLRSFGLDPDDPLVVVACEVDDLDAGLPVVERVLGRHDRRAAVAIKPPWIVGVAQAAPPLELETLGSDLHTSLGPASCVGVGGIAADARGLRSSFVGAEHACRFARRHGRSGYATHDELASLDLLLAVGDAHLLESFEIALLRPLEAHDAKRNTNLVETLERFLTSGGEYQSTADALHVHVNTLRLRLARIESLTGRRLASMEDRVDFWVALKSRTSTGGEGARGPAGPRGPNDL
ncbi:MAG TPA: PucR family transcriptional regulator ligand-binding domain-containing protein [Candidatus Limnocylindrales bacterium]